MISNPIQFLLFSYGASEFPLAFPLVFLYNPRVMRPAFVRGVSIHPENNTSSPLRVYGPESIRKTPTGYEFIVTLNGRDVALPFINVGSDTPVWIAYAHVRENTALARHARPAMVARVLEEIRQNPDIHFAVGPQSAKSQKFVRNVVKDASRTLRKEIPFIQLVGGEDRASIVRKASPGLVTECISVLSAAKNIVKYIGITEEDRKRIERVGGKAIWIDDVANTEATHKKSLWLINRALGLPPETLHPSYVIFLESVYGQGYPKQFPGIHALGHLPEFIGKNPKD